MGSERAGLRRWLLSIAVLLMLLMTAIVSASCSGAALMRCEGVNIKAMTSEAVLGLTGIEGLESKIWVTDQYTTLAALPETSLLLGELQEGEAAIAGPQMVVVAMGPALSAEDKPVTPEVRCTEEGVQVVVVVKMATPPGSSARRRIVMRPVLKVHLEVERAPLLFEAKWVLQSPDGRPNSDVLASRQIVFTAIPTAGK